MIIIKSRSCSQLVLHVHYNCIPDPLTTLAAAAVSGEAPVNTNTTTSEVSASTNGVPELKSEIKEEVKEEPKVPMRKENQWFDVGIIKGTSCVVSHYHLPSETSAGNGDVSNFPVGLLYA